MAISEFLDVLSAISNATQIITVSSAAIGGGAIGYLVRRFRHREPQLPAHIGGNTVDSPHDADSLQVVCETTHRINHAYRELLAPLTESREYAQKEVVNLVSEGLCKICPLMATALRRLERHANEPSLHVSIYFDTEFKTHVGLVASTNRAWLRDPKMARWEIANAPFRTGGVYDPRLDLTYWEDGRLSSSEAQWLAGWGSAYTSVLVVPIRGQPLGPHMVKQYGYLVVEAMIERKPPFTDCTKRLAAAYADQLFNYFNIMLKLYQDAPPGAPSSPARHWPVASGPSPT